MKADSPPKKEKIDPRTHKFRNLIFNPESIDGEEFSNYIQTVYKSLLYCVNHLKGPSQVYINSKKIKLPGKNRLVLVLILVGKRKTLFLDLDETLIHYVKDPKEKSQIKIEVEQENGEEILVLHTNLNSAWNQCSSLCQVCI